MVASTNHKINAEYKRAQEILLHKIIEQVLC